MSKKLTIRERSQQMSRVELHSTHMNIYQRVQGDQAGS